MNGPEHAVKERRPASPSTQAVSPLRLQRRLRVGAVDDPLEREADVAADRIVASLAGSPGIAGAPTSRIRRRAEAGAAPVGADGGEIDRQTESMLTSELGRGRALEAGTRRQIEPHFGTDFGAVRVHDDNNAHELNRRMSAEAFTVGSDIFFAGKAPDMSSSAGQGLLAHELTHVVQQGAAVARRPTPDEALEIGAPMSKVRKNERFAGQTSPDNPVKAVTAVAEVDDEEIEDEGTESADDVADETDDKTPASETRSDLSDVRQRVSYVTSAPTGKRKREVPITQAGPSRNNGSTAGSDCTPDDFTPADLTWSVVAKGKKKWGVQVTGLRTNGKINVEPTPNQPTSKTAPNTPNPVDGGNIENDENSPADWRAVLRSLEGYHTKNGGRGNWHDTAASVAHEDAHWNTDWMKNVLGVTWPKYRAKMERLTVSKSAYATADLAKAALKPKVEAKLTAFDAASTKRWIKVPDEPGDFFANGYLAGEKILKKHASKVRKYAFQKRWNLPGKIVKALTPNTGGGATATAATTGTGG